ncbi:hypothetical protein CEXT_448641, partial [Caerostris extrusa]
KVEQPFRSDGKYNTPCSAQDGVPPVPPCNSKESDGSCLGLCSRVTAPDTETISVTVASTAIVWAPLRQAFQSSSQLATPSCSRGLANMQNTTYPES